MCHKLLCSSLNCVSRGYMHAWTTAIACIPIVGIIVTVCAFPHTAIMHAPTNTMHVLYTLLRDY